MFVLFVHLGDVGGFPKVVRELMVGNDRWIPIYPHR